RYRPGATMGQWGTHFDRTQTWWEPGKALVRYWQRCQAMLQWGRIGPAADFAVEAAQGGVALRSIHRRSGTTDLFFVANLERAGGAARCAFKMTGRQPELWNPLTGTIRDLPEFADDGGE